MPEASDITKYFLQNIKRISNIYICEFIKILSIFLLRVYILFQHLSIIQSFKKI